MINNIWVAIDCISFKDFKKFKSIERFGNFLKISLPVVLLILLSGCVETVEIVRETNTTIFINTTEYIYENNTHIKYVDVIDTAIVVNLSNQLKSCEYNLFNANKRLKNCEMRRNNIQNISYIRLYDKYMSCNNTLENIRGVV